VLQCRLATRSSKEAVGRIVPWINQFDPQLAQRHVAGGVEPHEDREEFEHLFAGPNPRAEKLREARTLARIDRHSGQLEELDVEGILAFAERILPRASDVWVQASLDQRQRFQQRFFPNGIAFDGNRFVGTGAAAPVFSYLREIRTEMKVWWPRFSPDGTH
jgi:hypothetical protein